MKKIFRMLSLCIIILSIIPIKVYAAENIPVDVEHFPDEVFRQFILDTTYGEDGVLQLEEQMEITEIDLEQVGVSDLTGIEYFTGLESLWISDNQLTTLDLSKNFSLSFLDCANNALTNLIFNKENLIFLNCQQNQLTDLDIDGCIALTELYCGENNLKSLNLSDCTMLVNLEAPSNELSTLKIDDCTQLEYLNVPNNQLTVLDLSNHSRIKCVEAQNNCLSSVKIHKDSMEYGLNCQQNQLASLDFSDCTKLTELYCDNNPMETLNVKGCSALRFLNCFDAQLATLDVSDSIALEELKAWNNQLKVLNVDGCIALTELYCGENNLKSLDLSDCTMLVNLDASGNLLGTLVLPETGALEWLQCGGNRLCMLDVTGQSELKELLCAGNNIRALDLRKNPDLRTLVCNSNQMAYLDVSMNTQLESLEADENDFFYHSTTLDLTTVIPGFNVERATNWEGGIINGTVLTIQENDEYMHTSYDYDTGNGHIQNFNIVYYVDCEDWNEDGKCDICGEQIPTTVVRLSGKNRHITAIKIADNLKEVQNVEKFDSIIVAAGYNFADALAGSYLSTVKGAPILLGYKKIGNYTVDNDNIAYIKENLVENGTVYILGGTAAVSTFYEKALGEYDIKRLSGKNRFETNLAILKEAGIDEGSEILVCTGYNYADSLSASATGKPILLVAEKKQKIYGIDDEFLKSLNNCSFSIIGGTGAVSEKFETILKNYGKVTRLSGKNRFETSVLVAKNYFEDPNSAVLAYARNFPDGLCGGALAYAMKAPLILTVDGYEFIAADYTIANDIFTGAVLGGDKLISDEIIRIIFQMNKNSEIIIK